MKRSVRKSRFKKQFLEEKRQKAPNAGKKNAFILCYAEFDATWQKKIEIAKVDGFYYNISNC